MEMQNMEPNEIEQVRKAIQSHGDDFWNGEDDDGNSNIELFEEILGLLSIEGKTLKLVDL